MDLVGRLGAEVGARHSQLKGGGDVEDEVGVGLAGDDAEIVDAEAVVDLGDDGLA